MDDQKVEDRKMDEQKLDDQKIKNPALEDDSGAVEKLSVADGPETLPTHDHLCSQHPKPELAVTIRELLLRQSCNLPLCILFYYVLPNSQTAKVWNFHCTKFYIAAGVGLLVVNLPIYFRLRISSENPEFYYVGFGPVPKKPWANITKGDWNPRRITHSAKLRYIFPLAIVAGAYLLALGVLIVFDVPREVSLFDGLKVCRRPSLPVWKTTICYTMFGLLYVFPSVLFVGSFAGAFLDQVRICYNCLYEREWFAALNRSILDGLAKEESTVCI